MFPTKGRPSLHIPSLFTRHNLYPIFYIASINTQVWYLILHIQKLTVFNDSNDLLQTSWPSTHEPVRSDDGMIHSLDCSSILVSPSSLLSSSAQDEEGNLIYTILTRFRVISSLPTRWSGLQYTFSDNAIYEHGYPFGSSSIVGGSEYEISSTKYLILIWKIYW